MGDWREMRWLRLHAIAAPFGIFAVTVLLALRSGQWDGWASLDYAASLVDLGAVLYGMIAVLVERGVRMVFWALDERRKWREKRQKETQTEILAAARAAARSEDNQDIEAWLERFAQENDISLDEDKKPPR